jgi:Cu(I)/Ag(I) efflux system membrane fusion protein
MTRSPVSGRTAVGVLLGVAALAAAVVVAFALGYVVRWAIAPAHAPSEAQADHGEGPAAPAIWTCSMHPQIRLPKPGQCPLCGMDLILAKAGAGADDSALPRRLTVSSAARELMRVETRPVERRFVTATVRMIGKVAFNEARVANIAAWVPGRLDRLYVDYTGVPVRKGEHMVSLYSPQLLGAQEELVQALRAVKDLEASNVPVVRETAQDTVTAVREKLRLLGLLPEQIAEIEKTGRAADHVTIYAPIGGIVVRKHAVEGMYVEMGMPIYTIADLSAVWVLLEAYESDLPWLRYGQEVAFTSVAWPGRTFKGTVEFIDPMLDARTRTVKVRASAANAGGELKPDMFVSAEVSAQVAAGGRVMTPDLAGKWVCPMHPSVVKSAAGACDLCGMALETTESLGYAAAAPRPEDRPLVIPVSAALVTGTRAVAYVEVPGAEKPTFEGREIVLGPRAGDYYLVESGLAEGEHVVVRGNFKIDSALQIEARPSMMSPEGGGAPTHEHAGHASRVEPRPVRPRDESQSPMSAATRAALARLVRGYLSLTAPLAADDPAGARKALAALAAAVAATPADALPQADLASLSAAIALKADGGDPLQATRVTLDAVSARLIALVRQYGSPLDGPLYVLNCPMAFNNRGADWLQTGQEVSNPYFGAAMPKCGSVTATLPPQAGGHLHD